MGLAGGRGDRGAEPELSPGDGATSGKADDSLIWPKRPEARAMACCPPHPPNRAQGVAHILFPHVLIWLVPLCASTLTNTDRGAGAFPSVGQTEGHPYSY